MTGMYRRYVHYMYKIGRKQRFQVGYRYENLTKRDLQFSWWIPDYIEIYFMHPDPVNNHLRVRVCPDPPF
jgi:hypothetical protein